MTKPTKPTIRMNVASRGSCSSASASTRLCHCSVSVAFAGTTHSSPGSASSLPLVQSNPTACDLASVATAKLYRKTWALRACIFRITSRLVHLMQAKSSWTQRKIALVNSVLSVSITRWRCSSRLSKCRTSLKRSLHSGDAMVPKSKLKNSEIHRANSLRNPEKGTAGICMLLADICRWYERMLTKTIMKLESTACVVAAPLSRVHVAILATLERASLLVTETTVDATFFAST